MTNDLELAQKVSKVVQLSRKLNHLLANLPHTEMELFMALSDIEMSAHKGQERMNVMRYGREFKAPAELMGT